MGDVFISYARKDSEFVRRLYEALKERGREAWVDWEGIPPTDKWLDTIRSAIDEADAFLFVISPDSVTSEVCATELNHAIKQHKHLLVVMYREVETGAVRRELSEINYIFSRDSDSFDSACEQLITALDTDLEWIRAHTRLLVRATEWDREGRDASYTLRGHDLDDFEAWLAKSPDKEPKPTALQSTYLLKSRHAVTRRQRIVGGAIAMGLSLAVGLGTIAYFQNRESVRQETIAEARQLINKSEVLRDDAESTTSNQASTRAAVQALEILHGLGIASLEADRAVRKSIELPKWINFELDKEGIDASAFDVAGAHLALFLGGRHLMIWDTVLRRESGSCTLPLAVMESMLAVAVGGDGRLAVTAVYTATKEVDATEITLWSMPDCSRQLQVLVPGMLQTGSQNPLALSGNGENLVVSSGSTFRLWDVADKSELSLDFADLVFAFALSPDGYQLATLERNRGERERWIRIRDIDGNRMLREWKHPERGGWMQWRSNGLVVGSHDAATIYDPNNGEFVYRHPIRDGKFALSPDGRLVAVPIENDIIQLREAVSNTGMARTFHDSEVARLAFAPDNRSLITVDKVKRRIRVWSFENSGAFAELHDDAPIEQIQFSRNGSHLYTATGQNVNAWQLPLSDEHSAPLRQEASASATGLFGQYRIESSDIKGPGGDITTITVRSTKTGLEPHTITLDAHALAASVSQNGDRLAVILAMKSTRGGYERRLEVWNVGAGTRITSRAFDPVLDADIASYLGFSGEDRYLVVATNSGAEILDVEHLKPIATLYHREVMLTAMQDDGKLAATMGRDGLVRIWNMSSRNEIAQIETAKGVRAIALSNTGRWLASLDDAGSVQLWSLAPGDLIQQACNGLAGPCP